MATADQLKQGGNAAKLGAMSPPPVARGFAPASGNSSTPNPGAARPHPVGKITGKGTGTSDQVPINASNGEFIIKAAAVKKIGIEALEALNAIADGDPEGKAESQAEGLGQSEPRGFKCGGAVRKMATGGLVEDPKANSFGDAAAGSQNSQVKVIPSATPSQPAENSSSAITPSTPAASPPIQATGTPPRPAPGTPGGENFGGATAQMYQRMSAELNPPAATSQPVVKPSAPTPIAPIQRASTGADPLAGQYGHAAIGAPIDQGAAMDRKMLAQSSDASRMPAFDSGSAAFYQPKLGAVRGFATGGLVTDPKKNSFGDAAASNSNPQVKTTPTVGVSSASSPSVPTPQIGTEVDRRKAYEVANQKVNDLAPSYFTQQTPTSGQALENAKKNADAAYQNILAPTPSAANPPTSAVTPAAPAAIAPPAVSAGPAATAPVTTPVNTASPAGFEPSSNQVTKTTQPNGVTSYSGSNIAGDIALQNSKGFPIEGRGGVISAQNNQAAENLARKGGQSFGFGPAGEVSGGGQVSSINTSAGYAADLKQLAGIEAAKAQQNASMRDQENYAAMKAGHMSQKTYQAILARNQTDAITRRGQDIQASSVGFANKLAQEKLGLDKAKDGRDATAAGFTSRSAQRIEALQTAYESAKPEDKAGIVEQLRVLMGKDKPALYKAAAGGQQFDDKGIPYKVPDQIYNEQTGEVKLPSKAVTQASPLQNHIDALKKDPKLAQDFDRQYGAGSSSKILGTK